MDQITGGAFFHLTGQERSSIIPQDFAKGRIFDYLFLLLPSKSGLQAKLF
jgi:hypothetical protein